MASKDYTAKINEARENGFSDADIVAYLSTIDPKIKVALDEGYTNEEIVGYLSGAPVEVRDVPVSPKATGRTGMDKATQLAGVTTGALLPYATAAGLGAAAGAPLAGIGAIPGAAAGVVSLGIGDLATGTYNIFAPAFGGERVPLPSETIRAAYENVGIGRSPETAGERVYSDILQAGAGGFGQAKAFQNLADVAVSPQAQNFMRTMGQNARTQTAAAIGAGGAPSVASNYFNVDNPAALFALSLAGGGVGAKATAPKTKVVSAKDLEKEAEKLYEQMRDENVNVGPQAMGDLAAQARVRIDGLEYDQDTDKLVNEALDLFDKKTGKPISFNALENFRKHIRDLPYSEGGGKRGTPKERAIIKALDDTIDEFMDNLNPLQTTAADPNVAASYLKKARSTRARAYKTEMLETAVNKATKESKKVDSTKSFPQAVRSSFYGISKDERKMNKFDPQTQKYIEKVAEGTPIQRGLAKVGQLSPSTRVFGVQVPFLGLGAGTSPETVATILALQGGARGAQGIANKMTRNQLEDAMVSVSGTNRPGFVERTTPILSQITQQAVQSSDRARDVQNTRTFEENKALYKFPEIDPDSGEPLIDITYDEFGRATPVYGRVSRNAMAPAPR